MKDIVVYTCITGNKDAPIKRDYPITIFNDAYDRFRDPRRNSRIQKILSHKYFNETFSIYHDGNMKLLIPPEELIKRYMDGYDMAMLKHSRGCLYKEAMVVAKLQMDDVETIIEQAKHYEDMGFPKDIGFLQGGFIIRRNNERTRRFNEAWWADYCRYSRRDQLSIMPAIDESGVVVNAIDLNWEEKDGKAILADIAEMHWHKNLSGNFNDPKRNEK